MFKKVYRQKSRLLSIVLIIAVCLNCIPLSALAQNNMETTDKISEIARQLKVLKNDLAKSIDSEEGLSQTREVQEKKLADTISDVKKANTGAAVSKKPDLIVETSQSFDIKALVVTDSAIIQSEPTTTGSAVDVNQDIFPLKRPAVGNIMAAGSNYHTVGLNDKGKVIAIGKNDRHECDVGNWDNIVRVAAGTGFTLGLKSDGTVVSTGDNTIGQCNVSGWTDIVDIKACYSTAIGLKSNGTLVATGDNSRGQCDVSAWKDIIQIAEGNCVTLAIDKNGKVLAAGRNNYEHPNVENWTNMATVSAGGENHCVGMTKDGVCVATGSNAEGRCNVGSWSDIKKITTAGAQTIGLKKDGTVIVIGWNGYGQCNTGSWNDIADVYSGIDHVVGILDDGSVIATGRNEYGQCNVGDWSLKENTPSINSQNKHKYLVIKKNLNWTKAEEYCESLGGTLATITSQDEQDFIKQLIGNSRIGAYCIGGTDAAAEGQWEWITGEPFIYSNWNPGEPNNGAGWDSQNYAQYITPSGAWDDCWDNNVAPWDGSNPPRAFICEWGSSDAPSIHVNIPYTSEKNPYSNMLLKLVDTTKNKELAVNITDNSRYIFGGLEYKHIYKLLIVNKFGNTLDSMDNIVLSNLINEYSFTNLKQTQTVKLTVKDDQGNDVTGKVTVRWFDADNNFIRQGHTISELLTGTKICYSIALNNSLGTKYVIPDKQNYTVMEGDNNVELKLVHIPKVTLKGKITDSNGTSLQNAVISISQKLNDKFDSNVIASTNSSGQFSVEILNGVTNVIVSDYSYVNKEIKNIQTAFNGEVWDLGEIKISEIAGAQVKLNTTYTYNSLAADIPVKISGYDSSSINFSVFNKTKNVPINNISIQYPYIVILDDTKPGDKISITAASKNNDFKPVETTVLLDDRISSAADFDFVQNGEFIAKYSRSMNANDVAIIYDSSGKFVKSADFSGSNVKSGVLPEGSYDVIFMGKSLLFNKLQNFSEFGKIGLIENTDYIKRHVQIENGLNTVIDDFSIPLLDESKINYIDKEATAFTINKTSSSAGSYFTLRSQYGFNDAYKDKVSNVKVVFPLPENCGLMPNSVMSGSFSSSDYIYSNNNLIVPVTNVGDVVRFCVIPTEQGNYNINALLQFDLEGSTISQPIGVVNFKAASLAIDIPAKTAQKTVKITGNAMPNSDVIVYDNNVVVGQTKSLLNGSWSLKFELHKPYTYSTHQIYAEVHTRDGIKVLSETKSMVYDMNYTEVSKVTMINVAHKSSSLNLCEYVTVFDFINPSSKPPVYWYWPSYPAFTFKVEFTNNDPTVISNVNINVWTISGNLITLPATYDAVKQIWIANRNFDSSNLPANVSVSYDCAATNTKIDLQKSEDVKNDMLSLIPDNDDLGYLADITKQLKDEFNLSLDFDTKSQKTNFHADGLGDYAATVKNCRGVNQADLLDQGFILFDTTDGNKVYFRQDSNNITIADFKNNVYMELKSTKPAKLKTFRAASAANDDSSLLDAYNNATTAFDTLKEILEETGRKLETSAQKIEADAFSRLNSDPMKKLLLESASGLRLLDKALKGKSIIDSLNSLKGNIEKISSLISLYNQLPKCKDADALRADIVYTGCVIGTYVAAKSADLTMTICLLLSIPATGGASWTVSLPWTIAGILGAVALDMTAGYLMDKKVEELENRAAAIKAACGPSPIKDPRKPNGPDAKPVMDPSGYVYEAVPSNRLQGVTTTIYYKNKLEDTEAVLWDAAEYLQENPLITDTDGMYAWDVPQGWWQVKYEKDGYQTAYSDWLPVPPPQFDINVGLVSYDQPRVALVNGYSDYIDIVFDKYMKVSPLNSDNVTVKVNETNIAGTIEMIGEEENPQTKEKYAKEIHFIPDTVKLASGDVIGLNVSANVKSYADVNMMEDYNGNIQIKIKPETLTASSITLPYNGNGTIKVNVLPKEASAGKKIIASSCSPSIATVSNEAVVDGFGNAALTIQANTTGKAYIDIWLEGTNVQTRTIVNVDMPTEQLPQVIEPVASVKSGSVAANTQVELFTATTGASIYYTTDGTCPKVSETRVLYTRPITITKDVKILAVAIKQGMQNSKVLKLLYTVKQQEENNQSNPSSQYIAPPAKNTVVTQANFESLTVSQAMVTEAINKIALVKGKNMVILKILNLSDNGSGKINVTMPADILNQIIQSKADEVTIDTVLAKINLNKAAISEITKAAGSGNVLLSIKKLDVKVLPRDVQNQVGDHPLYNFTITAGQKEVSSFGEKGFICIGIPYTPKQSENNNSIVIYYIDEAGNASLIPQCYYDKGAGTVTFRTSHLSNYAVGYKEVSFKDVPENAEYSEIVKFITARGIASGTGIDTFSPDGTLTRGQFIVMVMKAYDIKPEKVWKDNFSDAGNTYYTSYLAAAKKLGVVTGTGKNMFAPNKEITTQEMYTLLYNALKVLGQLPVNKTREKLLEYSDSDSVKAWAKEAIKLFAETGIVFENGNKLNPADKVTRAQMVIVLYNLLTR